MKRSSLGLSILLAIAAVATPAFASQDSGWLLIEKLEADTAGLSVVPVSGFHNPNNCSSTDLMEMDSGATAADKELMNKVLLSAFLAGKQVKFSVSVSSCQNSRPKFFKVQVAR
jgi:hypothetical protein